MRHVALGFPPWIIVTHWLNFLFMTLMARSGIEVLSNHPRLYWNDHSKVGSEWLRFTKRRFSDAHPFASTDEEEHFSPLVALPGYASLGFGRYWHFASALGWWVVGIAYVVLLFCTSEWQRLVPTSWQIVPDAWGAALSYLHGVPPPAGNSVDPTHPYNALQQLVYASVVFILTPLQVLTGLAMSPALTARFPRYERLFGGRQAARSLHFLGLVAYGAFFVTHLAMVLWHGFGHEMGKMVLGEAEPARPSLAAGIGCAIIAAVVLINIAVTLASLRRPKKTYRLLSSIVDPVMARTVHKLASRQRYDPSAISRPHRMNGYPPLRRYPEAYDETGEYERLLAGGFADWRLQIHGLVRRPLSLSLADLRELGYEAHVSKHVCIQGWTSIGKWGGVPLGVLLELCDPLPEARYLAFHSFQKHEKAYEKLGSRNTYYYECIDFELAHHPQSIIALDLNGEPLSLRHGAPARLRVETVLGFKMVKYLRSIEVIDRLDRVGAGRGGCREDLLNFDVNAGI
jgi:sulfoxide reductase catalytic subunit YedY